MGVDLSEAERRELVTLRDVLDLLARALERDGGLDASDGVVLRMATLSCRRAADVFDAMGERADALAGPGWEEALAFVRAERDLILERVHTSYHSWPAQGCPACAELVAP